MPRQRKKHETAKQRKEKKQQRQRQQQQDSIASVLCSISGRLSQLEELKKQGNLQQKKIQELKVTISKKLDNMSGDLSDENSKKRQKLYTKIDKLLASTDSSKKLEYPKLRKIEVPSVWAVFAMLQAYIGAVVAKAADVTATLDKQPPAGVDRFGCSGLTDIFCRFLTIFKDQIPSAVVSMDIISSGGTSKDAYLVLWEKRLFGPEMLAKINSAIAGLNITRVEGPLPPASSYNCAVNTYPVDKSSWGAKDSWWINLNTAGITNLNERDRAALCGKIVGVLRAFIDEKNTHDSALLLSILKIGVPILAVATGGCVLYRYRDSIKGYFSKKGFLATNREPFLSSSDPQSLP